MKMGAKEGKIKQSHGQFQEQPRESLGQTRDC